MAFTIITTNKITILFFVLLLLGCSKATIDAEIKEETPTAETSLKEYAAAKGKFIGNLMRDGMFDNEQVNGGATDQILKTEYNAIVLGNKMKMANLLRNRPQDPFNISVTEINTENIDKFVAYADRHQMRKRGHVMIWYKQIPSWLEAEAPNWTAQQVYDFSKSYILALSSYSAGKIDEWDVINEAIVNNDFRPNTWYDIVSSQANDEGDIGFQPYFAQLFRWARQGDPNVDLFYNDYNIEPFGTSKNNFMRTLVKELKLNYAAPIDGVGLQGHFKIDQVTPEFIAKMGQTLDDLGNAGFTVNITELDIRICAGDRGNIQAQKEAFKGIVSTAFSRNNCNTILIWGPSDNDSWINTHYDGCGQATPHDGTYNKKPAYFGIKEALMEL
jgi:endo-1,4-beta-xylanase